MEISVRAARIATISTPLLGLPFFGPPAGDELLKALGPATRDAVLRLAREERFKGKSGQSLTVTPAAEAKASRVTVAALSPTKEHPAEQVRTFAHRLAKTARDKGLSKFVLVVPELEHATREEVVQWLAEGAMSGVYRYDRFLTGDRRPKPEPKRCTLVLAKDGGRAVKASASLKAAASRGRDIGASIALTRDLVNTPANGLTPELLAKRAEAIAEERGLEVELLDPDEIRDAGMGLLSAVGQGSANGPRFIHLTYRPAVEASKRVALVGKGVTFDAGGLSLKTSKGMMDMKCDMGGAGLVLGAIDACARVAVPVEVHALVPTAENMPSGAAYRPGDVFAGLNGKTVEVLNTDAEGRLILADALAFAEGLEPDVIIDFATLTGACMVALGPYRAGLWGTDEDWTTRYEDAAERAGEPLWRMPLARELRDGLKSRVADLRNIGGSWGGAISAALFLSEFVNKTPWLHVDIAGPAFLDKPRRFYPRGGTGYGILTVLEMLRALEV